MAEDNRISDIYFTKYIPFKILSKNSSLGSILLSCLSNQIIIQYSITEFTLDHLESEDYEDEDGDTADRFFANCEQYIRKNIKGFWSFDNLEVEKEFKLSFERAFYFEKEEDLDTFRRNYLILQKLSKE